MVFSIVVMAILAALCLWILVRKKVITGSKEIVLAAIPILLLFVIRGLNLEWRTGDYNDFLHPWVEFYREHGGLAGLGYPLGNYNPPYMYFLAIFSYFPIEPLYPIKMLSLAFEVLLAYYAMGLVTVFTANKTKRLVAFLLTLALPTVLTNGVLWGQCDAIYTAFALGSLYFALTDRPMRSVVFAALAFAFKLQAIFLLPIFMVLLYTNRVKIWHLLLFPATYILTILPAVIAGRPFWQTLTLYFQNFDTAGTALNYSSPSVYAFGGSSWAQNADTAAKIGIIAAFAVMVLIWIFLCVRRKRVNNQVILTAALLFVVVIPFLLPHMHERYFFMADVLTMIYAVLNWTRSPLAVLTSFASLLGYHAYLEGYYLLPMWYGAIALIVVIVWLMIDLVLQTRPRRRAG